MDKNTSVEQHTNSLPEFDPSAMAPKGLTSSVSTFDNGVWDKAKPMVAPMAWAYYDSHKSQKVASIGGFFTVTLGSFGIAEMLLTAIFGART
jgi:hypothetical protein